MIKFLSALVLTTVFALPSFAQQKASSGTGAELRVLDKVSGQSSNYDLMSGSSMQLGQLTISLRSCRFPEGAPANDAFAYIDVTETQTAQPIFGGWMIASSPALNAMEHSRYDVWVLRCKTS
ncbi:uncharacterized protein DUF2155 [Planktotalea frisia]|jgi:hypothetical protein|uniref:DUF2155 domain-containing protein n=1 Tax=Planktotalea frisia TaxID=696762 RepID=A0A1L9NUX7_9RHOB|nr:DUF2155 domain-containing protein [Planktotalea frisia]OJI93059.1 hypothetical protein PFRI_27070 [Planktotalea frisia]PZX25873.1 uncharacterized protein DUF2155 [Planktotalea frisia]